jgi:hypothetical protein
LKVAVLFRAVSGAQEASDSDVLRRLAAASIVIGAEALPEGIDRAIANSINVSGHDVVAYAPYKWSDGSQVVEVRSRISAQHLLAEVSWIRLLVDRELEAVGLPASS